MAYGRLGYVYFIQAPCNGLLKIGITDSHPSGRLSSLRKGSPVPLEPLGFIRGDRAIEHAVHVRFWRARTHGEWFQPTDELMEFVRGFTRPWPLKGQVIDDDEPESWYQNLDRELRKLAGRDLVERQMTRFVEMGRWTRGEMIGLA